MLLSGATLEVVGALRPEIHGTTWSSVEEAAQATSALFVREFASALLARVFVLVPFRSLPPAEQAFARELVNGDARLVAGTRVLALLGTAGKEPAWNDRRASRGHLAIPLLDRSFVEGIPMIAALLAELEVDVSRLEAAPIATRRLLGGKNGRFYVAEAASARDGQGRHVIAARDFVESHQIKTVFGMGGAYMDGTLAVAIVFANEVVPAGVVDLFPSLIGNFKMATMELMTKGRIFAPATT
ncbi:MAG: hypothetical protein WKG00_15410 [Polyangiaceae bacterium]